MTTIEKLVLCKGCRNNFYNGNNPWGIERCWFLDVSKPAQKKFIHIDAIPPWKSQPIEDTLNCHHRIRYIVVGPEVIC